MRRFDFNRIFNALRFTGADSEFIFALAEPVVGLNRLSDLIRGFEKFVYSCESLKSVVNLKCVVIPNGFKAVVGTLRVPF